MEYAAHHKLKKLLPRLSALTDNHRLKVLSDIDRVLAANGMTWEDIAATLIPPKNDLARPRVLEMIGTITKYHPKDELTDNAMRFLAELRQSASNPEMEGLGLSLSPRQADWLYALHERAEKEMAKRPSLRVVGKGDGA